MGEIIKNKSKNGQATKEVDDFNQMILNVLNLTSGNMLSPQNVLSWNVWATAPEPVDQVDWKNRAAFWRESLDSTHTTPRGLTPAGKTYRFDGTAVAYYDSVAFDKMELQEFKKFMDKHYDHDAAKNRATDPDDVFTEEDHKILGDLQKEVGKHIKEDIQNGVKKVMKKIF